MKELADQLRDLSDLFRQISTMVIEQGSVLDRIDFNVQSAKEEVKGGRVHIEKALEIERSERVVSC